MDIQGGVIMAKFYVGKGIDDYLVQLGKLSQMSDEMIKRAIYPAAGIVADAIKANIDSIPNRPPKGNDGLLPDQKRGLKEGLGVAPFKNDNGYINVKVGFDGYNQHKTETFPHGQPNAMIARATESGTSFSPKHPFVAQAVRKSKDEAEETMKEAFDEQIKRVMK
jgi:HK97 gp10 family phage protein